MQADSRPHLYLLVPHMLVPSAEADMFQIRNGTGICPAVVAAIRARFPKTYSDCALAVANPKSSECVPRQL